VPAKVLLLEKTDGEWSKEEVFKLTAAGAEVEQLESMPRRIAILYRSSRLTSEILGHAKFTSKELNYGDRWS